MFTVCILETVFTLDIYIACDQFGFVIFLLFLFRWDHSLILHLTLNIMRFKLLAVLEMKLLQSRVH